MPQTLVVASPEPQALNKCTDQWKWRQFSLLQDGRKAPFLPGTKFLFMGVLVAVQFILVALTSTQAQGTLSINPVTGNRPRITLDGVNMQAADNCLRSDRGGWCDWLTGAAPNPFQLTLAGATAGLFSKGTLTVGGIAGARAPKSSSGLGQPAFGSKRWESPSRQPLPDQCIPRQSLVRFGDEELIPHHAEGVNGTTRPSAAASFIWLESKVRNSFAPNSMAVATCRMSMERWPFASV